MRRLTPIADRLARRCIPVSESGCLLWEGGTVGNGYGVIGRGRDKDGKIYVHRLSWELTNGPIPKGLFVCHKCDVPCCINPKHLFLGTQSDNMQDCVKKGRHPELRRLTCKNGHPFDGIRSTGARGCSICKKQYDQKEQRKFKGRLWEIANRERRREEKRKASERWRLRHRLLRTTSPA